jgi:hypothetical protein
VKIAGALGDWDRRDLAALAARHWRQGPHDNLTTLGLAVVRTDAYRRTFLAVCEITPLGRHPAAILALTGRLPDPDEIPF